MNISSRNPVGTGFLVLVVALHLASGSAYTASRQRRQAVHPSPSGPETVERAVSSAPPDWNPSTAESAQDGTRRPWDFGVPVGGIGTGSFDLLPDGRFANFTLPDGRGNPIKDMPGTFLSISAKAISGGGEARILRARIPVQRGGIFSDRRLVPSVTYRGNYPFASLRFDTPTFPVRVVATGYSPFVPGNLFDSSLPAAIVEVEVENPNRFAVSVGVAFSWQDINSVSPSSQGDMLVHSDANSGRLAGISLSRDPRSPDISPEPGNTYYVATDTSGVFVTRSLHWDPRGTDIPWWRQFEHACRLQPRSKTPPNWSASASHAGASAVALCATVNLAPAERRTIPFFVTWYKPVVRREYQDFVLVEKLGYGDTFGSPMEVARYVLRHHARLKRETAEWHELINQSNLPAWLKSALCNSAARIACSGIVLSGGRYEPFSGSGTLAAGDVLRGTGSPLASLFPVLYRTQLDVQALTFSGAGAVVSPAIGSVVPDTGDFGAFLAECLRYYRWGADLPFLNRCYPSMKAALPRYLPSCAPDSALCALGTMSVVSQTAGDSDAATSFAARFKHLHDCLSGKRGSMTTSPGSACDAVSTVSLSGLVAQDFRLRLAGLPAVLMATPSPEFLAGERSWTVDSALGLVAAGAADRGLALFEGVLGKTPSWGVGQQRGNLPSLALAAWWLLPALGGLSLDLPAEILYFDPHLPYALKGELHIPVFTPDFIGWLDYNQANSAGALTVRKITDPAAAGRHIRRFARGVGDDGKPVGEKVLPAPFQLREGAVLPLVPGI